MLFQNSMDCHGWVPAISHNNGHVLPRAMYAFYTVTYYTLHT